MEKICNLYVDNAHLSVTLFEYMKKEIEKGIKVIIVSQDNVKKSIKNIKNMKENMNRKNDIQFLNEIDNNILGQLDNVTVVIQGDESFILKTEKMLEELFDKQKMQVNIVSCFNIFNNLNVENIINRYDKILNSKGITKIKAI